MSKVALQTLQKTVATSGTPVPLASSSLYVGRLIVQALAGNTGSVFITSPSGDKTTGFELAAGTYYPFQPDDLVDLSKIYVDAAVNGEGVCVAYLSELS